MIGLHQGMVLRVMPKVAVFSAGPIMGERSRSAAFIVGHGEQSLVSRLERRRLARTIFGRGRRRRKLDRTLAAALALVLLRGLRCRNAFPTEVVGQLES